MSDRIRFQGKVKVYSIPNASMYRACVEGSLTGTVSIDGEVVPGESVNRVCVALRREGFGIPSREEDRASMLRSLGFRVERGFVPRNGKHTQPALVVSR